MTNGHKLRNRSSDSAAKGIIVLFCDTFLFNNSWNGCSKQKDWTYFNTFSLNAAGENLICWYLGLSLSKLGAKQAIVKVNGIKGREIS